MRLILVRHGETTWNRAGLYQGWKDTNLTASGREAARTIGARLRRAGVTRFDLWASDLRRAVSTARIAFGRDPRMDRRLRELDFGVFAGRTYDENLWRFGDRFVSWEEHRGRAAPPGCEGLDDFSSRIVGWLEDVHGGTPSDRTVVAVTHGGVVRALVRPFVCDEHRPENGEITVLRWQEKRRHPTVTRWLPAGDRG